MAETTRPLMPAGETPHEPTAPRRPAEPLWRDALGRCLRRRRTERGEILTETARRAGVSPQYLSEMERGIKEPSSEMIAAVAGALDVTLADLALDVATSLVAVAPAPVRTAPAGPTCMAAYALAA
ncbi:helix-turn-helix domain-containing protein [Actinomadura violacea]|uniref:Helix-turn-helix transcriptional regulator n=1 Tax=Actinomadura violacea TaxID=2819934 RepID=A0ABS3RQI6_9ACTN|nr:helix-turn-helix transcriptional regulator [Actinomadura violacea]MBO2458912.1 helix-turn-helix transcriptional regulator [Actinomadura violacea]